MLSENINLVVLAIVLGTGGSIGYVSRIVQKIEDKRETIYLKHLPVIYYYLNSFIESYRSLSNNDDSIENFLNKTQDANEGLRKILFSAEIIMFKDELHNRIVIVFDNMQLFRNLLEKVKNSKDSNIKDIFRSTLNKNETFEGLIPCDILNSAIDIRNEIISEIRKYRSFSWVLLILVVVSAIIIGLIDFIKNSDFYKKSFVNISNSTSNIPTNRTGEEFFVTELDFIN